MGSFGIHRALSFLYRAARRNHKETTMSYAICNRWYGSSPVAVAATEAEAVEIARNLTAIKCEGHEITDAHNNVVATVRLSDIC
jgi:hypothetical protein